MNTTYFLNLVMGNVFHTKETPSIPSSFYIGLSTSAPSVDGTCDGEPTGSDSGYSRVLLNSLSAPSDGVISNTSAIDFGESTSAWGKVSHYVVYDAPTGGNLLFYGTLSEAITVDVGTAVTIKTENLFLRLSNPS